MHTASGYCKAQEQWRDRRTKLANVTLKMTQFLQSNFKSYQLHDEENDWTSSFIFALLLIITSSLSLCRINDRDGKRKNQGNAIIRAH